MDPIPYGCQEITEDDKRAVLEVLESRLITQGPAVEEFENAFKAHVDAQYAVAVANGTAALHLAALALNVRPGDKVLVTPNTFVASANCIRYCGGDVEFVDIDPDTLCMDLSLLESRLNACPPGTFQGVVCVDFGGYPMDMERLRSIADKHGLWILEDACHALGAKFKNRHEEWVSVGSDRYADLTVFSFHPVKHVTTGEGGMITSRSKDLYERLRMLRTHGITRSPDLLSRNDGPWYQEMQGLGFNYRLPDILCILGVSQMKRLDQNLKRRREIAHVYQNELKNLPLKLQRSGDDIQHAYHLYIVQTEERAKLFDHLLKKNILCQVHYPPVHRQPYYEQLYGKQSFPNCERYYERAISIPMYHSLTDEQQAYVINSIRDFFV